VTVSGPSSDAAEEQPTLRRIVLQDWDENRGRRKSQVVLALYRLATVCRQRDDIPRPLGAVYIGLYKVLTNWFMGVEFPPETVIGTQLRLFHPHAIVLHPNVRIGDRCTLRQCTTLGNVDRPGGPSTAPVVGDDVEIGAGVIVIGERHIGDRAILGAGAVVVSDVAAGAVVVGNPAKPIRIDGVSTRD
jgi:putative colanic acid biosynthesis acetyltransferase WcaB